MRHTLYPGRRNGIQTLVEIRQMLDERVGKGNTRGLLGSWAPQRDTLHHPAMAVFFTHGNNPALESPLPHFDGYVNP